MAGRSDNILDHFQHISKVVEDTNENVERYKNGTLFPYKTFSEKLNSVITGVYKGDQVCIAGRSGVGNYICCRR